MTVSVRGPVRGGLVSTLAVAAMTLAAMTLAACGDHDGQMVNSRICADFSAKDSARAGATAAPADAAAPVDNCVRRWAYSLAGARDGAEVVAGAAVAACGTALSHWNQTTAETAAADPTGAAGQVLSLVTGQPTDAMAEHAAFAQRQALLYVVQARAGRCKAPPAEKGVPVGVS